MKQGDVVTVYEDPITCNKEEGKAVLESFWFEDEVIERWHVRFVGEEEEGFFSRAINKENH